VCAVFLVFFCVVVPVCRFRAVELWRCFGRKDGSMQEKSIDIVICWFVEDGEEETLRERKKKQGLSREKFLAAEDE